MTDNQGYEAVIGLEVHIELKTRSKAFCSCSTEFGALPNTQVCPICLGLPGVLPKINREMVEYALLASLALRSKVASFSKFDRKNYYYPDLPKNYQISQYDLPLASGGYLEIATATGPRRIGITRLHMEEDAGKLVHAGATVSSARYSLVDYNRAGVPLLEIVSEPDIRTSEEARAYLEKLKQFMEYLGISDCKMEEGSLRCDVNVSIRPAGCTWLGTKTEIKNLNSFRAVVQSLEYEIDRQVGVLTGGGRVVQETRAWDEGRGVTIPLRSKEEAQDYRYFPEPDLEPLRVDGEWVEEALTSLPEMPDVRKIRFQSEYGLSEYDAGVLTATRPQADYFERAVQLTDADQIGQAGSRAKTVANWVMGDLSRLMNAQGIRIEDSPVKPEALAELLNLIEKGSISGKIGKTVLEEMFASGRGAAEVVAAGGLGQISDSQALAGVVDRVLAGNPRVVNDYRAGKEKALGFLVGQVMKETRGQANPGLVNKLLLERLS